MPHFFVPGRGPQNQNQSHEKGYTSNYQGGEDGFLDADSSSLTPVNNSGTKRIAQLADIDDSLEFQYETQKLLNSIHKRHQIATQVAQNNKGN